MKNCPRSILPLNIYFTPHHALFSSNKAKTSQLRKQNQQQQLYRTTRHTIQLIAHTMVSSKAQQKTSATTQKKYQTNKQHTNLTDIQFPISNAPVLFEIL